MRNQEGANSLPRRSHELDDVDFLSIDDIEDDPFAFVETLYKYKNYVLYGLYFFEWREKRDATCEVQIPINN